jgi:hypothetical protein
MSVIEMFEDVEGGETVVFSISEIRILKIPAEHNSIGDAASRFLQRFDRELLPRRAERMEELAVVSTNIDEPTATMQRAIEGLTRTREGKAFRTLPAIAQTGLIEQGAEELRSRNIIVEPQSAFDAFEQVPCPDHRRVKPDRAEREQLS